MGIPRPKFGRILKEFNESCETFVHVIEQLLVQICAVEVHAKKGAPSQSKVLSRIAEKVNMPRLNDYVQGVHEKSPQPRFLPLMTENLEILGTLTENMRHLVEQAAMVYKSLEPPLFLKDPEFGTESSGDGHRHHSVENRIEDDLFIIASVVDAMEREFELFNIASASINALSTSEDLSSYATLLRIQPFIMPAIQATVLSWAEESSPTPQVLLT